MFLYTEKYCFSNTATFKNGPEDNLRTIFWGYTCPPLSSTSNCPRLSEHCIYSLTNVLKEVIQSGAQRLWQNLDLVLHLSSCVLLSSIAFQLQLHPPDLPWINKPPYKAAPIQGTLFRTEPAPCPPPVLSFPQLRFTRATFSAQCTGCPILGHSFQGQSSCPPMSSSCIQLQLLYPLDTGKLSPLKGLPQSRAPFLGQNLHPVLHLFFLSSHPHI